MAPRDDLSTVLVLNGPSVDALSDLEELDAACLRWGAARGLDVVTFHSNHEGALIDRLQEGTEDALVINPGPLTHYSYALHDAISLRAIPAVEVQLTNVKEAEEWRRHSVIEPACVLTIWGRGISGYDWALRHLTARAAGPWETVRYGPEADHVGDLRLPSGEGPHPVVVLLHGGFWRDQWRRDLMDGLAVFLTSAGFATWNLEYRRIGPGGGWPATLLDVADGVDHLRSFEQLDTGSVTLLGHSAGGQLALWAAARGNLDEGTPGADPGVIPDRIVALAAVSDLATAEELGLDDHAVSAFLRGPADHAAKYKMASPIELLPLGAQQLIAHGDRDEFIPVEMSRRYARAARAAGDDVTLIEITGGDHMSLIDESSESWLEVAAVFGER